MAVTQQVRKDLLAEIKRMAPDELDAFIEKALALRIPAKADTLSQEETGLLKRINRGLPADVRKRYAQLSKRRDSENLRADEHRELLELTRQAESQDADRAAALLELSKLRRLPLRVLMKQLGIKPRPVNG